MFRSLLFVPGHRPDRFEKALATGADAVCIDLEDAVAPQDKDATREKVAEFLKTRETTRTALGVRVNSLRCADGVRDLARLLDVPHPDFVLVPKAEDDVEMRVFDDAFAGKLPVWALIETARGVENVWSIARAPSVKGFLFGAADYSVDARCLMEWEPLLMARSQMAAAAGGAGIEVMDVPHIDVNDIDGLRSSTQRVHELGFTGRSCIHPSQLPIVHDVFTPSKEAVAHAQRVIDAFEAGKGSVALLDGKLIERPLIMAARRVITRAEALGAHTGR